MYDQIVDEVRRVREELIDRYGGLHGYIKHLQAMDRQRARKAKQRTTKRLASNGRRRRTRATKSKATRATKTDRRNRDPSIRGHPAYKELVERLKASSTVPNPDRKK